MATIDNLSIQVTASAESAASALDRLASSAGGLRGAVTRAGGGLRDLSAGVRDAGTATQEAGQQAGNAERHTRNYGRAAQEAGNAARRGTSGISSFLQALRRVAYYRFIRTVIKSITSAFSKGIKNIYNYSSAINGHFAQSMDKLATSTQYLKNSLGTLVAPLMEALAPALEWLIDRLVEAINFFNMFVAAISGRSTYTAAVKAATSWGKSTSNAASDAANSVKDSVEEMKRTILGFDEINKLDGNKNSGGSSGSGGSGGGSGGSGGASGMFEERTLSGGFQQFSNALELAVQDSLSRITLIIGAAELAVGAILALSGANLPLGLALMATGAVTMGSAIFANWEGIPDEIKVVVGAIEAALGGGLAVGAVLAFSTGHIGLGIGMMIAALSLEWSAVDIVWTTLKDKIGGQIKAIEVLVGGALIGIGAVLAFAGHPAIGLAMLVAGLTIEAVAIDWGALTGKVGEKINELKGLIVGAETVLGVIFLLTGNIPLGLALLIAGGIGAGLELVNNWGNITEWFAERWKDFKKAAEDTWDLLKEIGAGIWGKIQEGITGAVNGVKGVGAWIKEHIFKPFVDAWHWLLGLFGGGNDGDGITANASVNITPNASSVADDIAESATDKESIQKLKEIGATMSDAIKSGMNERLKNVSGEIWGTIVNGWNADTRDLPVGITYSFTGNIDIPKSVDLTVNLVKSWTGTVISALGINSLSTTITATLVKSEGWMTSGWKQYLGLAKLSTTIIVYLTKTKGWMTSGWKQYLGLAKLSTTIIATLTKTKGWMTSGWKQYLRLKDLSVTITATLVKSTGWMSAEHGWKGYLGLYDASVTIDVDLSPTGSEAWKAFKDGWNNSKSNLTANVKVNQSGGSSGGGGSTSGGGAGRGRAFGGVFANGIWKNIPQYANGTTNAHGSMFLAGEAGPELVGHVGGRTEVLNQSQLAATMFSAVRAAMGGVKIAAMMYDGSNAEDDYEMMYRAMYDAFTDAMAPNNARDQEKMQLMREIAAKEFTAEVTANSINRAQQRMNRRAGTTIVPVTT